MLNKATRKSLGSFFTGLVVCVTLLVAAGCDELTNDFLDTAYYGWDDGSGDDFYSNWYTDTTVSGDDDFFYIAGDDFTYSSW